MPVSLQPPAVGKSTSSVASEFYCPRLFPPLLDLIADIQVCLSQADNIPPFPRLLGVRLLDTLLGTHRHQDQAESSEWVPHGHV